MTPEEQAARESEIRDRWQRQHAIREAMRAKGVEPTSSWYDEDIPWLLAALRTAREEADAEIAHQRAFRDKAPQALADAVRLAREEEREACAKIADSPDWDWHSSGVGDEQWPCLSAQSIAAAIRARAKEQP